MEKETSLIKNELADLTEYVTEAGKSMPTILVIEDDADLLEEIALRLELENFTVHQAWDGSSGIQAIQTHQPDLVICDVNMPGMSGFEVLSEVRSLPGQQQLPFLFLTAQAAQDSIRKGMMLGADDYITKPFQYSDLLGAVRVRLQRRQQLELTILQAFAQLVIDNDDATRRQLARRLKEHVAEPLNSLRMLLRSTGSGAANAPYPLMENAVRSLDDILNTLEQLQVGLMPEILQYLGTSSMLHWLRSQHERAGLQIQLQHTELPDTLPEVVQRHLFYIMDEVLRNVRQHAQASTVQMQVNVVDGMLQVTIADDGVGFDVDHFWEHITTLGIVRIRERARACGGSLTVLSDADVGTTVHVRLSLMSGAASSGSAHEPQTALAMPPTEAFSAATPVTVMIAHADGLVCKGLQHLIGSAADMVVIGTVDNPSALMNVASDEIAMDVMVISASLWRANDGAVQAALQQAPIPGIVLLSDEVTQTSAALQEIGVQACISEAAAVETLEDAIRAVTNGETFIAVEPSKAESANTENGQAKATAMLDRLTPREREILEYVANNYQNAEIADELVISIRTVETHRANMMHKLHLKDKSELLLFALRVGIISLDE